MAKYYDAIYSQIVDYDLEFNQVQRVIQKHFGGKPEWVLDVACGRATILSCLQSSVTKQPGSIFALDCDLKTK